MIADFVSGTDKIDLSAIDAMADTPANDAFIFIGTLGLYGLPGLLRYEITNGQTHIYADRDGDGLADMHILLATAVPLTGADFIL